jgi:tight adherence protein C
MSVVILGALAIPVAFIALWWALSGARIGRPAAVRNLSAGLQSVTDMRDALLQHPATDRLVDPLIGKLAKGGRRLTPSGMLESLERRIASAGGSWTVDRVLAAKAGLAIGGGLIGFVFVIQNPALGYVLLAVVATALGWFLPDLLLYNQAQKRQAQIQMSLPDTLDQITISVEAGLGLEAAMARAGRSGKGPLAEELVRTLQDMHAGRSRAEALRSLADRAGLADLNRVVLAMVQAENYGVPISRVLNVQSAELRVKRRQYAEERAMKLPVKVLFPMMLCIMPALFIVLLGPAAIRMSHLFHSLH